MTHLPPALQLMREIWQLNRGLELASRQMNARHGITGPQRFALRIIAENPGIAARELTAALFLDRSSISSLLAALSAKRLVSRRTDKVDRRLVHLTLTAKGHALLGRQDGTIEELVTQLMAVLPAAELRKGTALLSKLAAALTEQATASGGSDARR